MKLTDKLRRWLLLALALPLVVLNGWLLLVVFNYFQSLITIVILASLLSFILDYPVQLLQRSRVKRSSAVLFVLLLTFLILIALGVTLVPILLDQLNQLAKGLPKSIESGVEQFLALQGWAEERNLPINLKGLATLLADRLSSQLQAITGQILSFAVGTVGRIVDVLLTVVLTFYLLLHGDRLWEGLFQWLPPRLASKLQPALRQNFHNYFIGQATLASMMGLAITIAFLILQVPYGLLFGLGVGVMTLIPFGAGLSISFVSLLVALNNFWLGVKVLVVAFLIDQGIENGIAPRLLGGFTGLNPVWVLVSLLVGAKVGGLLGVLVAVPLASFIKSTAESLRLSADTSGN